MTIYKKIVSDRDQARKDKNTENLQTYQTIIGEINRNIDAAKLGDDVAVVKVLKKLAKNWQESYNLRPDNKVAVEIQLVMQYVPAQLTEIDLLTIKIKEKPSNLGVFMKHLKENFDGQYDGALAKKVFEGE